MIIPKNASEIIRGLLNETRQLHKRMQDALDGLKLMNSEISIDHASDYNRQLFLLIKSIPFEWTNIKKENHYVYTMRNDETYYFRFFNIDGSTEEPKDVEIPVYLFIACKTLEYIKSEYYDLPQIRFNLTLERTHYVELALIMILIGLKASEIAKNKNDEYISHKDIHGLFIRNNGRILSLNNRQFTFTKLQAPIIELFWDNFHKSNDYIIEQDALEAVNLSNTSFANIFKSRKKEFNLLFEQHPDAKDLWRIKLD